MHHILYFTTVGIVFVTGALWAVYTGVWRLGIFASPVKRICSAELLQRFEEETAYLSVADYRTLLEGKKGGTPERWANDELRLLDI